MVLPEPSKNDKNTQNQFYSVEWLIDRAVQKHKEGKNQEAVFYYKKSIEQNKQQPPWVYGNTVTLLGKLGQTTQALELGNCGLEIHPDGDDIFRAMGIVLELQGDLESSTKKYQRAVEINREQPEWVYSKLEEYLRNDELQKHLDRDDSLSREFPESSRKLDSTISKSFYIHCISELIDKNLIAEAFAKLQQALLTYPEDPDLINLFDLEEESLKGILHSVDDSNRILANLLIARAAKQHSAGDLISKGNLYQQAIALDENQLEDVYIEAITIFSKLEDFDRAFDLGNLALSVYPLSKKIQESISLTLEKQTNQKIEPDTLLELSSIIMKQAESAASQGQWKEAISFYQKISKIQPKHPQVYHYWGDALSNLQQWQESIQLYSRAIVVNPDFEWSYCNMGNSFIQLQQWDAAIIAYQNSLKINPHLSFVYSNLCHALKMKSKVEGNQEMASFYDYLLPKKQNDTQLPSLSSIEQSKLTLDNLNKISLSNFLDGDCCLELPTVENPQVSIILILYNRAELTLSCLYSILRNNFKSLEIVIVDNASSDDTRLLLERIEGAKIILNDENLHFLRASNQGSRVARGDYLLFLNNDAQVLGNSISAAVNTISSASDIGAVGGKIILPDGTLQEAGSTIWQDGSCAGYGRGRSPTAPEFMFKRSVDYCSGAFLLTDRRLFLDMGCFDEKFNPAYYEETDYCVRLLKAGKKIIYDPAITVLHHEFASSTASEKAIELQKRNKKIFIEEHQEWLQNQLPPSPKNVLASRFHQDKRKRILFIEDRVPHPFFGSGFPRSHAILSILVDLGYFVTLYTADPSYQEEWKTIYSDMDRNIEVIIGYGLPKIEEFLQDRKTYYDLIFVTRPHNMQMLNNVLSSDNELRKVKLVYDAEALYCLRDFAQKRLQGAELSEAYIEESIKNELNLAQQSDYIISVSSLEKNKFTDYGYEKVGVLGHCLNSSPLPKTFSERKDILFVGAIHDVDTPNADSVIWLGEEIFPNLQSKSRSPINLLIAGTNKSETLQQKIISLENESIQMLGRVNDLSDLYNDSRLFIAPTRFGAGIALKVVEAASYGIPVVATSLIADQLGWKDGNDLLVADNAEQLADKCLHLYNDAHLWERLRNNALQKIQQEYSEEYFRETLKSIVEDCLGRVD